MGKGVAACKNAAASRREIRVQPPLSSSQTMVHVSNQALVLREISVQCSQNAHPFHPAARSVSTGPGQRQRPNSLIRFPQKTRGGRTSLTFGSRPDFELRRLARSRFPGNRQGLLHVGVNRANDGQGVTQLGDITNFPTVKGPMNGNPSREAGTRLRTSPYRQSCPFGRYQQRGTGDDHGVDECHAMVALNHGDFSFMLINFLLGSLQRSGIGSVAGRARLQTAAIIWLDGS
ncbi:hypothetical protein CCUS01_07271 [Colletotrichum cuscutae]|uniref:Uncharacterized protein n=1 Tax=Colletotrichum cuscutae TaxID=1209917 RepID=A0AAI9XWK6_9PEZI|nr:hypothetical protein CCUS01_07271 [Colletotrichum cuscutae]